MYLVDMKTASLLLLLLVAMCSHSQYLNYVLETDNSWEYTMDYNFDGGQLASVCTVQDSNWLSSGWDYVEFKRYDENLNVVTHERYVDSSKFTWSSRCNLIYLDDYYYYAGSKSKVGVDTITAFVMKIDTLGNLIWEKEYEYNGCDRTTSNMLQARNNHLYYYVRYWNDSLTIGGVYLTELDTSGNSLWLYDYPYAPGFETAAGFHPTPDGGFLIASSKHLGLGNYCARVRKMDSLGNEEWVKFIDADVEPDALTPHLLDNGNYLLAGSSTEPLTNTQRCWLVILNSSGDILQDSIYDFSEGWDTYYGVNVINTFDGFQIIGFEYEDQFTDRGEMSIARYDYDLNLLWHQTHYAREYHNICGYQTELPSGFFLVAGHTMADTISVSHDEWFVIVDSLGCALADCSLGVEELEDGEFGLIIYPNPAKDMIKIKGDEIKGKYRLLSLSGQSKMVGELENNSIHIESLPTGVYILELNISGEIIYNRVIVE